MKVNEEKLALYLVIAACIANIAAMIIAAIINYNKSWF